MNNEGKVTVREAFTLAGVPVPEGATLLWAYFEWYATTANPWLAYVFRETEWVEEDDLIMGFRDIDISNRPAIDAYDALPEIVRAALPKEDTKR